MYLFFNPQVLAVLVSILYLNLLHTWRTILCFFVHNDGLITSLGCTRIRVISESTLLMEDDSQVYMEDDGIWNAKATVKRLLAPLIAACAASLKKQNQLPHVSLRSRSYPFHAPHPLS